MNFVRNRVRRRKPRENSPDDYKEHKIFLGPGDVEEVSHYMKYKGNIELSGLTFYADPVPAKKQSSSVQSFIDIAIFEVPEQCTSQTCDMSKYGVGKLDHFEEEYFVNLCENGRLRIDSNVFQGFHTQLMVPFENSMPKHLKRSKLTLPNRDQNYDVIFANCNENGRSVQIIGQIEFDIDVNQSDLGFQSAATLTVVALCICLFLTTLTVRIQFGTRSEYEYERLGAAAAEE